jgi:hypothetical protein
MTTTTRVHLRGSTFWSALAILCATFVQARRSNFRRSFNSNLRRRMSIRALSSSSIRGAASLSNTGFDSRDQIWDRGGPRGIYRQGLLQISRKAEWPDWHPPPEMIERQPYLPRFMAGGPGNPLDARAMYLGNTVYRIHGTQCAGDDRSSRVGRLLSARQ